MIFQCPNKITAHEARNLSNSIEIDGHTIYGTIKDEVVQILNDTYNRIKDGAPTDHSLVLKLKKNNLVIDVVLKILETNGYKISYLGWTNDEKLYEIRWS